MLKATARTSRIAAQMQRSLALLLRRDVKDPRVGNVTVTAVDVANDLSYARIHVLPFAGGHAPAQVLTGLRSAAGFLRGQVARELKLRHAPRLEFRLDIKSDTYWVGHTVGQFKFPLIGNSVQNRASRLLGAPSLRGDQLLGKIQIKGGL